MAFAVQAQYYYVPSLTPGNPGGLNTDGEFPVGGGLDASWTSILGPSVATPTWSAAQTISFPFSFNGVPVSSYFASSTGVVTFSASPGTAPGSTPVALPSASIPDNSICALGIAATGTNDNVVIKEFGSAGSRQHWVFFTSMTNPGDATCWHYYAIVFEEGTDNIYIVDARNACDIDMSLGIQLDAATAYSVAGSPAVAPLAELSGFDDDNFYYTFVQGTQPAYDMAGISFDGEEFNLLADAPFDITGELINLGSTTITSLDINYSVDGASPVTANLTGLNIAPYDRYSFSHPTLFNPGAEGVFNIEVWASNLNGNADEVMGNDRVDGPFGVYADFTDRLPLYETFTSSTCPPCTPANVVLEDLFNAPGNADKYTSIKYQQDFPGSGDPYFTEEAGNLRAQYAINSIPRLMIDGGWNQNAGNVTQSLMDDFASEPSFIELSATYELLGQAIGVEVEINPLIDISNPNLVLKIAVFEYETFNNEKTNGETEFFHVMKKMLPDETGSPVGPFTAGTMVTAAEQHEFQGDYRLPANASFEINHATEHSVEEFEDLGAIVWIQDEVTLEVLQSTEATLKVSSIGDPQQVATAKLYPNPVQEQAILAFQLTQPVADLHMSIFSTNGQQVAFEALGAFPQGRSTVDVQTAGLAPGTYMVQLEADGRHFRLMMQVVD
jgi:hypothetical protein